MRLTNALLPGSGQRPATSNQLGRGTPSLESWLQVELDAGPANR